MLLFPDVDVMFLNNLAKRPIAVLQPDECASFCLRRYNCAGFSAAPTGDESGQFSCWLKHGTKVARLVQKFGVTSGASVECPVLQPGDMAAPFHTPPPCLCVRTGQRGAPTLVYTPASIVLLGAGLKKAGGQSPQYEVSGEDACQPLNPRMPPPTFSPVASDEHAAFAEAPDPAAAAPPPPPLEQQAAAGGTGAAAAPMVVAIMTVIRPTDHFVARAEVMRLRIGPQALPMVHQVRMGPYCTVFC
eukprot:SAG22_NODE_1244_length_5021_cov_16.855547_3_plen_245_part_00